MSRHVSRRSGTDRGSATVLVAGACLAVIVVSAGALMVTSAAYVSARARAAADLSAVAAATARLDQLVGYSGPDPCSAAATVAVGNGATLTSCAVDGSVNVSVSVTVPAAGPTAWMRGPKHAAASARAGPAPPRPRDSAVDTEPGAGLRRPTAMSSVPVRLVLGAALCVSGCGSQTASSSGSPDDPVSQGADDPQRTAASDLLADTVGDSPFYLDSVAVRVAESYPVQLFLDVTGSVPTPCHLVSYTIKAGADEIGVTITTTSPMEPCAQVLQGRELAIPLGPAELPVTVSVNDGQFVETVRP